MVLFLTTNKTTQQKRPADQADLPVNSKIPPARYYRKTLACNTGCTQEVIKVENCNDRKVRYSANTVINADPSKPKYYASRTEYLRARCRTYDQGVSGFSRNTETNAIRKDCCDTDNQCGVYKKSNAKYNKNSAVSSSSRIHRLKYDTIASSRVR